MNLRAQDTFAKIRMKDYHDQKSNVQTSTLKARDNGLINKTGMECLTAFDKDPVKIARTKGSQLNKVTSRLPETAPTSRKLTF